MRIGTKDFKRRYQIDLAEQISAKNRNGDEKVTKMRKHVSIVYRYAIENPFIRPKS